MARASENRQIYSRAFHALIHNSHFSATNVEGIGKIVMRTEFRFAARVSLTLNLNNLFGNLINCCYATVTKLKFLHFLCRSFSEVLSNFNETLSHHFKTSLKII